MECLDMDIECFDEDFEIYQGGSSEEEDRFDFIVGRLEEIVMSEEFLRLKDKFFTTYSSAFSLEEESQEVSMQIFEKYGEALEQYIVECLPDIDLGAFCAMLSSRQDEIDGALSEMLLSLTDFQVFKDLIASYNSQNLIWVEGARSIIYVDEVEDGEARPDLEGLIITPYKI